MAKIAVLMPSMTEVKADFALSLAAMAALSAVAGHSLALLNEKSSLITAARNNLVRRAQEVGAGTVLFIDSDLQFPPDLLVRLLAHDKDIVGATYNKRVAPYTTLGEFFGPVSTHGLTPCGHLPGGMLMVKMGVFERLAAPWFRETYEPGLASTSNPDGVIGEDVSFCMAARAVGFTIHCDMDLTMAGTIFHIGERHIGIGPAQRAVAA